MKTPLFVKRGPGGMFSVVNNELTTGNIYWVNSASTNCSDSAGYGINPDTPFATIAYAIAACTANNGDRIFVSRFHTETLTAALAFSTAGVNVFGLTNGITMATLTINGAVDGVAMSAADCSLEGIAFAAPGTDEQLSDVAITAARCVVKNTRHIGSTTTGTNRNKVDIITLSAAANDVLLDGLHIYNSAYGMTGGGINIAGAFARGEIRNCFVAGSGSVGFASGCLYDAAAATQLYVHHNVFKNNKATTASVSLTASLGVFSFNHVSGRNTTLPGVFPTTTMDCFENRVTKIAAVNGAITPVADADL